MPLLRNMKHLKNDIALILSLIGLGALLWLFLSVSSAPGKFVTVTKNGDLVGSYPLSEDREIPLDFGDGENLLVIEDGHAYMESASCPDKICVKHKAISKTGESIVCLPNKVIAEITGDAEEGVDLVS